MIEPKPIVVGSPNHLLSIDELWVFISKDKDGNEGVCGAPIGGTFMPLVAADPARVDSLRRVAQMIVDNSEGHEIILRKFSNSEDQEVIRKK
jgi:hypothetical protein